jgi:Ca-activated chloride channel family protein
VGRARRNDATVAKAALVAVLAALLLAACTGSGSPTHTTGTPPPGPNTLTILAGSELQDVQPILPQIERDTGLDLRFAYTGSLSGADQIAQGTSADVAWFSSSNYLNLAGASSKVLAKESVALSPVVMGVKRSLAERWGWVDDPTVTWQDVAEKASTGELKYAMTNPAASNSGFSALVGVASAYAGTGNALTTSDIDVPGLKRFFSGQALTAGSSGFLADAYVRSQDSLGGLINYESILLSLNAGHRLHEPLSLIYPRDGIVTADYPVMLLDASKHAQYDKLIAELRTPAIQRWLMTRTDRRPVIPQVRPDSRFPTAVLVELSFPSSLDVVHSLLDTYLNEIVPPSHTIFVLDTSGSMDGARLDALKDAMEGLAGVDTTLTGSFAQFRNREDVTIIPFSSSVHGVKNFTVSGTDPNSPERLLIRAVVESLIGDGNTAIYSALARAYQEALASLAHEPDRLTSIVLMTDGENNAGMSANAFLTFLRALPEEARHVRTFPVLFGEADPAALHQVADVTGGKVFDSRTTSLSEVFKEIRGYQ